jgi:hypothetical protein
MVNDRSNIPSIRTIFEKNDDNSFTKEALFYQNILEYPIKTGKNEFKLRSVGNWLLEFNDELIKRYDPDKRHSSEKNMSKSKRFANIRDRLEAKIEDLIHLGLLSSGSIRAERVDTQIPLYSLTGDGYFISLLLERTDSGRRKNTNMLYELIQSTLKLCNSNQAEFLSRFYEYYKQEGLLDEVFDLVESILQSDHDIKTVLNAIEIIPIPNTKYSTNEELNKKLHNISTRLFYSLDEQTRNSQLAYIKSQLENRIFEQYPPEVWHLQRRLNIGDPTFTVLYGVCNECGFEDAIPMQTGWFIYEDKTNIAEIHCKKCSSGIFNISTELPKRPMRIICEHFSNVQLNKVDIGASVCEECGKTKSLRKCLVCDRISCASSEVDHAFEHFKQTGHAVIAALSATNWKWCYTHKQYCL